MPDGEPILSVVRGTPTAEELAALVGALLLRPAPLPAATVPVSRWARAARPDAGPRPVWQAPAGDRSGRPAGRGAWWAAALPRR